MTPVGSVEVAYFTINGVDLLAAKLQALSVKIEVRTERTDGLGDAWEQFTPTGLRVLTITQAGAYFTADVDAIHGLLIDWPPGPYAVELALAGAAGPVLLASGLMIASYEVLARQGQLTRANATYAFAVTGAVTWAPIVGRAAEAA